MAVLFLETSALVKRYVAETGSRWVLGLTDPAAGNVCWLTSITRVEVLAALYLRVRTGTLLRARARHADRTFRRELRTHFRQGALIGAVLARAMRLVANYPLRAYDAVQLAAALHLQAQELAAGRPAPTFICADQVLNRAAVAEGLAVDDPTQHP
jgi:predicted nucleic acid-binding protein